MPLGAWSFRGFGTVWELALWELLIVVNGWMWHGVAQGFEEAVFLWELACLRWRSVGVHIRYLGNG